ncbi:hypothetical protein H2198_001354 [Neophaeococcomyces mojaviensis]|uniref:Uncharacterized protein n=1 Tax=Neophaeococcomyces mojaviensis TaxID=3383035 RepID=A0ACC3AH52_9EURO|nr:hypothetical protein H2198_001354 [Knufia sp. JES_112]
MEPASAREDQPMHRDIRSREKALNRRRKQSQKYYGYRGVKPSWVGQKYYTLAFVPIEDTKAATKLKHTRGTRASHKKDVSNPRANGFHDTDECLLDEVIMTKFEDGFENWIWNTFYYDNYINLCASEARGNKTLTHAPVTLSSLESTLRDSQDPTETIPKLPADQKIVFTLATWTKQDNFAQKETGIYPLDRRHHRGKRYREKCSRKWNMEKLGRGTKMLHVEQEEHDKITSTRRDWLDDNGVHCCEQCIIESDVDDFMDGEFQDPTEFQEARNVLHEALKEERLAEGDFFWTLLYGKGRVNEDRAEIETEVAMEDVGGGEDAFEPEVLLRAEIEYESDIWSEIMSASEAFEAWHAMSRPDSDFDVLSDVASCIDAEWEVLSSGGGGAHELF